MTRLWSTPVPPPPKRLMTAAEPPTYPAAEIEALIAALTGVLAARVVLNAIGHIDEIHVLADEQLQPKQIVRNIESALGAGLAVSIDRRIVSVAQLDDAGVAAFQQDLEAAAATNGDHTAHVPPSPATASDDVAQNDDGHQPDDAPRDTELPLRYIFVGYDARTQPDLEATCRVTIRRGDEVISGSGSGPCTPLGRAQAAARAVFAAIATARQDHALGLEGATVVDSHGRAFVLVAAHASIGRDSMPLTGVAALHRSPEEAAILAALQATNRWAELDG